MKRLDVRLVLIIVSLLAVGWLQAPRLSDEFRVDEDFRSFYWMSKFQDSSLFPNYFQGYATIHLPWGDVLVMFESLGYGLLFYGASFFITPILFSKILPFLLMPITVWYLFQFGQSGRDRTTGILLAVGFLFFNLASSSSISTINGLQRSFVTTLIIALIYYVHRQKYLAAVVVIFLSALIYAPVFAFGVTVWGLCALKISWRVRRLSLIQGGLGYLLVAFCLGTLILLPILLPGVIDVFGMEKLAEVEQKQQSSEPPSTYKYMWNDPSYQTDGISPLFIIFPLVGRGGLVDMGEDMINLLIFFVIGCLIYLVRGRKALSLPKVVWCMLWGTLILFVMAWLVIWLTGSPLLYWPSRYTRVGLFMFGLIFVLWNIVDFVKESPVLIQRNPKRLIWLIVGIEVLILGLVIWYPSEWAKIRHFNMKWLLIFAGGVIGILGTVVIRRPPRSTPRKVSLSGTRAGRVLMVATALLFLMGWAVYAPIFTEVSYLNPPQAERALFKFLETLPKDTLIAGTPCALDSVPLFAKRQALFSCEFGDRETVIPEALQAYYTDDKQVIIDFCHTHNIDYLVVDLKTYSEQFVNQRQIYFEPYNQKLLAHIAGQDTFVLAEVPDEVKIFQTENFFVVPCDALDDDLAKQKTMYSLRPIG
ncbi:hypothetical protein ACFLXQ_02975 [Chloroflexota bacterium]